MLLFKIIHCMHVEYLMNLIESEPRMQSAANGYRRPESQNV